MEKGNISKVKITEIVSDIVKADQGHMKLKTGNSQVEDDDVIVINVGGIRHETKIATLLKKPETRLFSVATMAKTTGRKEFYFDRNPQIFPCILNYYRIGQLHIPTDVCGPAIKAELDYWELEDKDIEECCWVNYISYEETMSMLEKFQDDDRNNFHSLYITPDSSFYAKVKPKVWRTIQDPYSSRPAFALAIFSFTIVLVSITVFVIETLPYFDSVYIHASYLQKNITSADLRREMDIFTDVTPNDILLLIDNFCNVYFFLEFVIKLIASPDKRKFIKSPTVITELVCLIPYYIGMAIVMLHKEPIQLFTLIRVLFATRVLRIFRIFVLMKHFLALKILIYTIRASTKELFLLLIVLIIGVIVFGCIEYYMEIFSDKTDFQHIPLAFWWAVITMTTIGYGDIVPNSGLGYAVGGICAVSGVLVIALSVPVIVNNFTVYYTHAQSREKLKIRKQKFERTEKWQRLKQGLKSKLKNGALLGIVNGVKPQNHIRPSYDKPAHKTSLVKLGNRETSCSEQITEYNDEIAMPITVRNVFLEDLSETDNVRTSIADKTSSLNETNIDNIEYNFSSETKPIESRANKTNVQRSSNTQNVRVINKEVCSTLARDVFKSQHFLRSGNKFKKLHAKSPQVNCS